VAQRFKELVNGQPHPKEGMPNPGSIRSYLHANGWYLLIRHSLQKLWIRGNSAVLARALSARGLTIEPPFHLNGLRYISIGEGFSSGPGLWLDAIYRYQESSFRPTIVIGANVSLSRSVHIAATNCVCIGADVLIGSKVMITDHNHGTYSGDHPSRPSEPPSMRQLEESRRTVIGDRVWLGDGVVVTAGATIGDGAVIGANSVVVGEIPSDSIAVGIPAMVIRRFDKEQQRWVREIG
jgi:acetyltransferase-like isoleucine patch superfamily enzyme